MSKPSFLTDGEFEAIQEVAAQRARALGISKDQALANLLDAVSFNSRKLLDNMGLYARGPESIIDMIIAHKEFTSQ